MNIGFNNALVTGGAGFIGSHLVEALLSLGCTVKVLDNLSTGDLLNLQAVKNDIVFFKNDIRDLDALEKAAEGCEVIFHLAAVVAVQETISNPVESAMVNDIGTINVLEAARREEGRSPAPPVAPRVVDEVGDRPLEVGIERPGTCDLATGAVEQHVRGYRDRRRPGPLTGRHRPGGAKNQRGRDRDPAWTHHLSPGCLALFLETHRPAAP